MLTEKMESNKGSVLATRLTPEIMRLVVEIATIQGLNSSEYLRALIINDLEKRSLISTKLESLKEKIRKGDKEAKEMKTTCASIA